jgi:hypothetical protein
VSYTVNEPTTQKGYGVRSRITDKQPQFYIHHLLQMFKFRCEIIFTGRTAVTETRTSVQALSNEMRLVTQCGRNYQQSERNQKVTYKSSILKLLMPYILISFFLFTKQTKCIYNIHNSTISQKVCTMNEHAVQCIHSWCTIGVPKQRINRFSSAPQMFRYGTLLSLIF